MKKILKPLCLILFLFFEFSPPASAHQGIIINDKIREVLLPEKSTPVYEGNRNNQVAVLEIDFPKAATTFSKMYSVAQSPVWFKNGKRLNVYFQHEGNRVQALLTKKGRLVYAVTYLNVSAMPERISKRIQDAYSSYSVFNVQQIRTADFTVYRVTLENCNGFVVVQADEEEIIEIRKILKVSPTA